MKILATVNHAYSFLNSNVFGLVLLQMEMDKRYSNSQGSTGAWQTEFDTFKSMFSYDEDAWVAKTIAPSFLLHLLAGHYADRPVRAFWFDWAGHGRDDMADNGTAKNAFRTMTQVLEDAKITTGLYPKSKAIWGMVFEDDYSNGSTTRAVIWANGSYPGDIGNPWKPGGGGVPKLPSNDYQVTMSIAGSGIQAFDYLGNQINDLNNIPFNPMSAIYMISNRYLYVKVSVRTNS